MVTVIEPDNSWADAARKFGGGLVEGYTQRADEQAIQKAIMGLGANPSARQILDTLTGTKTYSPKSKQEALKNYIGVAEFEEAQRHAQKEQSAQQAANTINQAKVDQKAAETGAKELAKKTESDVKRQQTKALANRLNLPDDQKEALGDNADLETVENLVKEQYKPLLNPDDPNRKFKETLAGIDAEKYAKAVENSPVIDDTLANIDYAEQLSDEIGLLSSVSHIAGFTEKGQELEGIAFTLMEPIVKMFNPSGPIAERKLQRIQDKYAIKASDLPATRKAKINALRRFAQQAKARNNGRIALLESKHLGKAKDADIARYDRDTQTMEDVMLDYDLSGEEVTDTQQKELGMPSPAKYKNKTITSPDGTNYKSDGLRWVIQ